MKTPAPTMFPVSSIIPYARNSKIHPKEQIEKIARQISEVGFLVPIIIDKERVVIAGHGRLEAAKNLGLEQVPVIIADHMTEAQAKAFRIADNKVAESAWDYPMLAFELGSLDRLDVDLTLSGFDMNDVRGILGTFGDTAQDGATACAGENIQAPDFSPGDKENQSALDHKKPIECPNCGHVFSPFA